MIGRRQARLLAVLVFGVVLAINFPMLTIVEAVRGSIGVNGVPVYIYGVWALAILGAALILERRGR